jgi:hypothetical protein
MSDEIPKPRKLKPTTPSAEEIEAACMVQLAREAVETIGADAILIVWTKQRKRKTEIKSTAIGNMLTVHGLMRYIRERIDEIEDPEDEDEEDDESDEDDE